MAQRVSQELVEQIAQAVVRKLDEREKINAIAREVVMLLSERQARMMAIRQPPSAATVAVEADHPAGDPNGRRDAVGGPGTTAVGKGATQ